MKNLILFFIALTFMVDVCEAKVFRRRGRTYSSSSSNSSDVDTSSAQGVAEGMARKNWVGHFGGHGGMYEGCASGSTKEQAYNNCCFANDSSLKTVDVGYAQNNNGRWFCCRRYVR